MGNVVLGTRGMTRVLVFDFQRKPLQENCSEIITLDCQMLQYVTASKTDGDDPPSVLPGRCVPSRTLTRPYLLHFSQPPKIRCAKHAYFVAARIPRRKMPFRVGRTVRKWSGFIPDLPPPPPLPRMESMILLLGVAYSIVSVFPSASNRSCIAH